MIGRTLSNFRIVSKLGAGGMGEVYLAEDTELGREVAVKVLPTEMAADPERLERFQREARSVAALNHPNIVTIYSVEKAEDVYLLTMEKVAGASLDRLLPSVGFPLDQLFPLAIQIAEALAAAHDKGITHRDLKPANVMVTPEGRVKILDFGLAKLAVGEATADETQELTQEGMVLGTVPYMSPEQVQGRPVDARSDLFSLGILLYEMATGQRPFRGDNPASVISAVLRDQPPPVTELKRDLPNHLGRIVRRCLEKQPQRRYPTAREVQLELEELQKELADGPTAPGNTPDLLAPTPHRRLPWAIGAALGALLLFLGLALGRWSSSGIETEPARLRTLTVSGFDSEPDASPDGRLVAFTSIRDGRPRIWIKQLATGNEEVVTAGPDSRPRFSPDGSALLFSREEGGVLSIYRQALIGGQPRKLIDQASDADWSPDGAQIAYTRSLNEDGTRTSLLGLTNAQGGNERILMEAPELLSQPRWSPDGTTLAVALRTAASTTTGQTSYLLIDVESGASSQVGLTARQQRSNLAWVGNRLLVFAQSASAIGDQGDPLSSIVLYSRDGERERTLFWVEDLFPFIGQQLDATVVDVLGADSLVFHTASTRQTLREIDLESGVVNQLTRSEGIDRQPFYTLDGRSVLFSSNRSGNLDIWRLELESGALRQLTDDPEQDYDPAISPDGEQLIWTSDRSGNFEIWIANIDGSGGRQLTHDGFDAENPIMTPDGEWVVYWSGNPEQRGVWKVRPDGSEPTVIAAGPFANTEVSSDGRYVAYLVQSPDNLETRILVSEVETAEAVPFEIQVNAPLGAENIIFGRCRWSPDGRRIVFVAVGEDGEIGVFDQEFAPGRDTTATRRRLAGSETGVVTESFGLSPDGQRMTFATLEYTWQIRLADGVALGRQ